MSVISLSGGVENALKACSQSDLSRDEFVTIAAPQGARTEPSKSPALLALHQLSMCSWRTGAKD